jgi:hypothetical protein
MLLSEGENIYLNIEIKLKLKETPFSIITKDII